MAQQIDIKEQSLSKFEKSKLLSYKDKTWIKSMNIYSAKSLLQKGQEITLMTSFGKKLKFKLETEVNDYEHKLWQGKSKGNDENVDKESIIELFDSEEGLYGYALYDSLYFEIASLGNRKFAIIEHDVNAHPNLGCLSHGERTSPQANLKNLVERTGPNSENCRIKVLVFYTADAFIFQPDLLNKINTSVAQTNTAFANSGINGRIFPITVPLPESSLSFSLPVNASGPNISVFIDNMNNDSYINSLRSFYKADLIIVVDGWLTEFCMCAGTASPYPNQINTPTALVGNLFVGGPRFTFTHELGHLLNAAHNDANDYINNGRGHSFTVGSNVKSTIMDVTENPRILHFSNPEINFQGVPTGTATRDNSFNINTRFCPTSDYIDSYDLGLSNVSTQVPGYPTTVTASVDVNQYPCTLQWYADTYPYPQSLKKTENITTTNLGGFYNFTFPSIPPYSYYYVRAKLTPSVSGSQVNKTVSIFNAGYYQISAESLRSADGKNGITIFPNPSKVGDDVNFKIENETSKRIRIVSQQGNTIQTVDLDNSAFTLNCDHLGKGFYMVLDENGAIVGKFQKID